MRSPFCWAHTAWKRPELAPGLEAEVAGGDPLAEEAGRRKLERDVAHLEPLDDLVLPSLVEDVDVVGGGELPGLVVVDVEAEPLGHGAGHAHAELELGADLGKEVGAAAELHRGIARPEAAPLPAHLGATHEADRQVRMLPQDLGEDVPLPFLPTAQGGWLLRRKEPRSGRRPASGAEPAGLHEAEVLTGATERLLHLLEPAVRPRDPRRKEPGVAGSRNGREIHVEEERDAPHSQGEGREGASGMGAKEEAGPERGVRRRHGRARPGRRRDAPHPSRPREEEDEGGHRDGFGHTERHGSARMFQKGGPASPDLARPSPPGTGRGPWGVENA